MGGKEGDCDSIDSGEEGSEEEWGPGDSIVKVFRFLSREFDEDGYAVDPRRRKGCRVRKEMRIRGGEGSLKGNIVIS